MKSWPLADTKRSVPLLGPGSFWEDRKDRHHCGVDLYAKEGTVVLSMDDGVVTSIGIATSPEKIKYWNTTSYIIVKHGHLFVKYSELGKVDVKEGDAVKAGEPIGKVGLVLDSAKISHDSPAYIQELKDKNPSMLHLEFYKEKPIIEHKLYLGGNWFGKEKPKNLLDPKRAFTIIK